MTREDIQRLIDAFEAKDLEAVLAEFAEDAYIYDPHYPQTDMVGKDAIRQGMEWAFGNMEKPGFTIRNLWIEDDKAALELDTHHVFKGGMELVSPQVFIIETRDGLITRLQSYMPYRPGGLGGWMAKAVGLSWRVRGKAQ
jgi:ketosteroid isomerase-like protein